MTLGIGCGTVLIALLIIGAPPRARNAAHMVIPGARCLAGVPVARDRFRTTLDALMTASQSVADGRSSLPHSYLEPLEIGSPVLN
jgi:hypothetical protein